MRYVLALLMLLIAAPRAEAATACSVYDTVARMHDLSAVIVNDPQGNTALAKVRRLRAEMRFFNVSEAHALFANELNRQDQNTMRRFLTFASLLSKQADAGEETWRLLFEQVNARSILNQSVPIIGGLLCASESDTNARGASLNIAPSSQGGSSSGTGVIGPSVQLIYKVSAIGMPIIIAFALLFVLLRRAKVMLNDKKRRRARRFIVETPILFATGAINYDGILCDISRVGIRIRHDGIINGNKTKLIKVFIHTRWYEGKVMRCDDTYCGVAFEEMLTHAQLRTIRHTARDKNSGVVPPIPAPVPQSDDADPIVDENDAAVAVQEDDNMIATQDEDASVDPQNEESFPRTQNGVPEGTPS